MCDYSLEAYKSESAKQGESYTITRMPSYSKGLTKAGETDCVVCLAEGSTLRLEGLDEGIQAAYKVSADEDVTFLKMEASTAYVHRDGVKFQNGETVSFQRLNEGAKVTLLMPMAKDAPEDTDLAAPAPAVEPAIAFV